MLIQKLVDLNSFCTKIKFTRINKKFAKTQTETKRETNIDQVVSTVKMFQWLTLFLFSTDYTILRVPPEKGGLNIPLLGKTV